jgi:hypothetical protein
MPADRTYKVGYGRPPIETRFKKGVSGNPAGRKPGRRNVSSVIAAALAETVVVNENGRRRTITKLEAAFKQMANKAAGGDARATKLMIELLHQSEGRDAAREAPSNMTPQERQAADRAALAALRDYLERKDAAADGQP